MAERSKRDEFGLEDKVPVVTGGGDHGSADGLASYRPGDEGEGRWSSRRQRFINLRPSAAPLDGLRHFRNAVWSGVRTLYADGVPG